MASPAIRFLAGQNFVINDLAGSGLGFYGAAGFGASVQVGAWQDKTFITNSVGTTLGPEAMNIKFTHPSSGIIGQTGSGLALTQIPNWQSTLNVRFTSPTAVKTQNVQLRIYDRTDINSAASGVTTKVAEVAHPDIIQGNSGSGSTTWQTPAGSGTIMTLTSSPGVSGLRPNGPNTTATQHDWYLAISASPDSIGSKTLYGLYVSLEYL
jgi:hypothetical protein